MSGILITGAGGFLGLAITRALADRGEAVFALESGRLDRLTALASTRPSVEVVAGDICNAAAIMRLFADTRPRAVIHCAAIVGVLAALDTPARLFRVNVEGSINLFEAMARHGTARIIHVSSEEIYGNFTADRIDETHCPAPLYGYGVSKLTVEHLGRGYRVTHGLECINIRTSWVYGPAFPRDRVPMNMVRAAAEGQPLHVPCGAESRIDHTYIDDAVAGVLGALDHEHHVHDAYHVASGDSPSLAEIADIVADLAPGAPPITVGPGPYKHDGRIAMPRKGALDCTRAAETFGYEPKFDIHRGLQATFEAHRRTMDTAKGAV